MSYSHAYAFCFSVETEEASGENTHAHLLRQNILKRLAALDDAELAEAVGVPVDSAELPPHEPLALYFVADNGNPEANRDLMVWAVGPATALLDWRRYYETEDTPAQVFVVPTAAPAAGAIDWHMPEGVHAVEVPS